MQGEHGQFLILKPVRGDLTAFAKEDEVIRAIPLIIPRFPRGFDSEGIRNDPL